MLTFFQKKVRKNNKGFTLVELIVVIAILGILAAIAVPRVIGFQEQAKTTANHQTAAQVKNVVAMGISSGAIKIGGSDKTGDVYMMISGTGTAAAVSINNGTTTTIAAPSDLSGYVNGFIDGFNLKTVGGKDQAVFVKIENTQVQTIVTEKPATTPAYADMGTTPYEFD